MNLEQTQNEIIKTPEVKVKEGVDFVFEQNPELVNTAYEALGFVDFSVSENSGYITLYRAEGETVAREELLPFQKGTAGTWFSPDQKELLRYVAMMKGRKAYKIDIPKSLYESLNSIAKNNIEMSKGEVQLPIELADKKEILTSENENIINKNYFKSWIISNRIKSGEITEEQRRQAKEMYSKYLGTIFPDSKVKDIVYHTSSNKIEKFRDNMFGTYFSYSPIQGVYGDVSNSVLLNVKSLLIMPKPEDSTEEKVIYDKEYRSYNNPSFSSEGHPIYKYDASIESSIVTKEGIQIKVRNPEQIHILGSEEDITKFKEFVSSKEDQIK